MNDRVYVFPHVTMYPSGFITKAFFVALTSMLAYVSGEVLVKGGLLAAIVGGGVAVVVEGLRTLVALRQERRNDFAVIDKRLEELHSREKRFLALQISYLERLEMATRKRLHAMVTEVQRCVYHITICTDIVKTSKDKPPQLPEFKIRTYEEIVKEFPLPDPPMPQVNEAD